MLLLTMNSIVCVKQVLHEMMHTSRSNACMCVRTVIFLTVRTLAVSLSSHASPNMQAAPPMPNVYNCIYEAKTRFEAQSNACCSPKIQKLRLQPQKLLWLPC